MQRKISNRDCQLFHTVYCDMLNMPACEVCFVNEKKSEQQVISDLDALRALMPEEGIHSLFTDDHCVLCKGQNKGERAYYGLMDLGHHEPKRTKRSIIGIKVKVLVGSLLPIQFSTCQDCRRRILNLAYIPILIPLALGVLAMIVLMLPGVSDTLEKTAMALPLLAFLGVVLAGVLISRMIASTLRKKYDRVTHLDPSDLPILRKMQQKGWFVLNKSGKYPRLIFSRERMHMGVGTGAPEDALCPDTDVN